MSECGERQGRTIANSNVVHEGRMPSDSIGVGSIPERYFQCLKKCPSPVLSLEDLDEAVKNAPSPLPFLG